jgi:hypothetical protein
MGTLLRRGGAGDHDVGKLRHTRIMVMIQLNDHFFRPQQPGGALPIPLDSQIRPSGAMAEASMTATSISPKSRN